MITEGQFEKLRMASLKITQVLESTVKELETTKKAMQLLLECGQLHNQELRDLRSRIEELEGGL